MANIAINKSETIYNILDNVLENVCETTIKCLNQEQQNQQEEQSADNNKPTKTAQKKPPDILCNCPQKCYLRVPPDIRSSLYKEFCSLGDHVRQNAYLQSYIEMRSVYKRLWCQEERIGGRLQRRVSCKYKIPVEITKTSMRDDLNSTPKLTTNSKGQTTIVVGVREGNRTIEVCQKAFMNVYGITEKRIRLQREKLIARLRADNPESQFKNDNKKSTQVMTNYISNNVLNQNNNHQHHSPETSSQSDVHDDDELSIVDTFFRNQLWKPEYIGITSDKLNCLDMYYNNVRA